MNLFQIQEGDTDSEGLPDYLLEEEEDDKEGVVSLITDLIISSLFNKQQGRNDILYYTVSLLERTSYQIFYYYLAIMEKAADYFHVGKNCFQCLMFSLFKITYCYL